MAEAFEFEVRPIEGATAVVGEEVTFREEGGKLYALNEDGEAFGVVPKAVAARLEALGIDSLPAEVSSHAEGMPAVSVAIGNDLGSGDEAGAQHPGAMPETHGAQSDAVANGMVAGVQAKQAKAVGVGCGSGTKSSDGHDSSAVFEDYHREDDRRNKGKRNRNIAIGAIVIILLVCIFVIPHKAADVSDEMYELGREAIEVAEDYLDGDISSSEAYEELGSLQDDAFYVYDQSEESGDLAVYIGIDGLYVDAMCDLFGINSESEALESAEEDLKYLKDNLYMF